MLQITQIRSAIGTKPKQRGTLRALGLGRIGRCNILPDRPDIRGMIQRVPHLVKVEEITDEAVVKDKLVSEVVGVGSDTVSEGGSHEPNTQTTARNVGVGSDTVSEGGDIVAADSDGVVSDDSGADFERDDPETAETEAESSKEPEILKLHNLASPAGARKRAKRVARGIAGKGGKTAGRGMKGQRARGTVAAGFEGGQMPLLRRVPKLRGFTNPFRVEYQAINLDTIEACGLSKITPQTLLSKGLISKNSLVKVLGRGEISRPVQVHAHAFSKTAQAAIEAAGGSTKIVAKPWGDRRPPHGSFNQHTNR